MTDTNSAISVAEGRDMGIFVLPMPILIDEAVYLEGEDITCQDLFRAMADGHQVSTSQPAPTALLSMWDRILDEGFDQIVYIPMSGSLSSSAQTARQLSLDYSGRVFVADNRRISLTQRISVLDAKAMADSGADGLSITKTLEAEGANAAIYIAVDDMSYLKRSGRITPAAAQIAAFMHIKPILKLQEGKLDAWAKVKGMAKSRHRMIQALEDELTGSFSVFSREQVILGTAGSFSDPTAARAWREEVQQAFPDFVVQYVPLSCSISSHTGPDACGLGIIVSRFPALQADAAALG